MRSFELPSRSITFGRAAFTRIFSFSASTERQVVQHKCVPNVVKRVIDKRWIELYEAVKLLQQGIYDVASALNQLCD